MKKLIMVVLCLVFVSASFAESWNIKSNASLNLTQSYYSDAWSGGDLGSISWTLNFNASAEKQLSEMFSSENTLKLAFGQTHSSYKTVNEDGENEVKWESPVKSTDKIDFESVLRMTLDSYVDPYISFRAESQFYDKMGDETKYFNPLTLTQSIGASKYFIDKENHSFSTRLGFGLRELINQHNDGDTPIDGGLLSVTDYSVYMNNGKINYTSKLTLFQALFNSESDNLDDLDVEWDALDVDFENTLTASVTDYIDVSLFLQLRYDKEESDDVQFKETLGLGVSYTFAK
ncbi:MAG: hypothetical protein CR982_03890 [Candidatus Cloacimonadota bacterium]|nr:MAG: hypothetical protein CR982_03890 [Candidatus Cloacimonadota bacterium]PIE78026.1 MAG: hypothetical protein CSA15_10025 [Candidatus Delongbacteria bacterium]